MDSSAQTPKTQFPVQPQPSVPQQQKTPINQVVLGSQATSEKNESYDQIRRLGEVVEKAILPQDLRQNLLDRVSRLALLRSSAGFMSASYILEYESTQTYINWVTGLPWDRKTQDILDLVKAKEILDKNHYGLEPIKSRILDYLASVILNLRNNNKQNIQHAPILCLVGLAGTGKTTLAASIAEALGKQFERVPFGGMADSRVLRGQSRALPDAEPGQVIKKLTQAKSKNPVMLLDELDRVTENARADIMGVLIELLDPEQNFAFTDHYIDYPFDLTNIIFVATANNTNNISTAVLDRLEIIQMPSYTDEEKTVIAEKYLFPKIRRQTGLLDNQLIVQDFVWPGIIRPLGFDSGIRSLERTIDGICRRAARAIVEGRAQSVTITVDNLKDYLPTT